jgi:uncharacterized protein
MLFVITICEYWVNIGTPTTTILLLTAVSISVWLIYLSVNNDFGVILMTISMYQASMPGLIRSLSNLAVILAKADAHATAKKIDPTVLMNSRLSPDMLPLSKQVQIASDISRRGAARLAGLEAPAMADTETTFPELIDRLQKTIDYLKEFTPAQIDGSEEKEITLPVGKETMKFAGMPYLLYFILPNVYFHVTTAYGILRHSGVELGKADFLGKPE